MLSRQLRPSKPKISYRFAAIQHGKSLSYEVTDSGVGVVTLNTPNKPVNSLDTDMMENFDKLFSELANNSNVKSVLVKSAKPGCFVAGADIGMIDACTNKSEALKIATGGQQTMNMIANSTKPVIAAMNGATLGGGLELALACHYRIALNSKKTKIGLPEVMLGLLPGAGGTQRLPKLIGLDKALPLILTGKQLNAKKAKRSKIVHHIVEPLGPGLKSTEEYFNEICLSIAEKFARGEEKVPKVKVGRARQILETALKIGFLRNMFFDKFVYAGIQKNTSGVYPAPLRIADVLKGSIGASFKKGSELEADGFADLSQTPESKACIHLFNGQNHCKKNKYGNPEHETKNIGVIGAGLMGAGISSVSIPKGYNVLLRDMNDEGLQRGFNQIDGIFAKKLKRKVLTKMEKHYIMNKLNLQTDYSGFENVDMVIEAVNEQMSLKHLIVKQVEEHLPEHAIFATNTSALSITEIASVSKRPEKVVGMHYFSPVDKMMLLEIIPGEKTSDDTLAAASKVGIKQGKLVVVVKECPGFFANRCLGPLMAEIGRILQEGKSFDEVDKLTKNFGFPVGLVTLFDEVGIDVGGTVGKYLQDSYGKRMSGGDPAAFDKMIESGFLGKKTSKGFYTYDKKNKRSGVNADAVSVLNGFKIEPKDPSLMSTENLQLRVLLRFTNEAVLTLQEGIIASATDGDIASVFGVGYPARFGGPFKYVDTVGAKTVVENMNKFKAVYGEAFEPCDLLKEMAENGKKFY